ncbi:hypothetical protein A73_43 [Escherichia phage A73]|uniref:Uncharacterized protein n=1 Tax=Escherichia phage A73 TaxID=3003819 RepID=A0AAE9VX85_9CAUD|nr:hypothetical protein A73_43 [Escherichia phage A73]
MIIDERTQAVIDKTFSVRKSIVADISLERITEEGIDTSVNYPLVEEDFLRKIMKQSFTDHVQVETNEEMWLVFKLSADTDHEQEFNAALAWILKYCNDNDLEVM